MANQRPYCGRASTIQYPPKTISAWRFFPSKPHRNVVGLERFFFPTDGAALAEAFNIIDAHGITYLTGKIPAHVTNHLAL
jgi:hypothetical protein